MELETLGPFKIGRVLGRGGMGAVYEGTHQTDGSVVAIKVQPDSLDEDAEIRVRFDTEIETLKRLHHPNIVRLTGFGAEQGYLYYVMELVDGPSLQQELRKKRLFQWYEVAKIGIEICQALRHAHDRGVIHRDIKPANILLDQEGNVKLSDFGIARFFGSQQITDIHSVIGTLEYMSPEQALANPIHSSTDLYSLGCVLYTLITGKVPFPARSLPELLRKHNTFTPASIRSVRHDVPDELGYIIADMLQIRPEDRPRNASLVTKRLQSLVQALKGSPTTIKVLPMQPGTPIQQPHESSAFLANNKLPAADDDSGSMVDLARVPKPEMPDSSVLLPQGETLTGSFKRIGEKHSVSVFPDDPVKLQSAPEGISLGETLTSTSARPSDARPSGSLQHGEVVGAKMQTSRPAQDEPLPDAIQCSKPSVPSGETTFSKVPIPQDGEQEPDTSVKPMSIPARFTTVTNKEFDPFEEENQIARPMFSLPMILASTMLMIIGLTVYYLVQPVPPDVLYARIIATIREGESEDGPSPAQLRSAQNDIRRFLHTYPDHPSAEQVWVYQDELDLSEHERRLERRMQFSTLRSLSPVERTYISVLTSSPHDPDEMIDKLRAFIAVFQTVQSSEESVEPQRRTAGPVKMCVELARRRLKKMEQDAAEINAEQEQVVRRRLDEALEWDSTDPMRAEGIRRGIIELYQNYRWAKELVDEAKQLLESQDVTISEQH